MRAIIFDLDGVLADSEPWWNQIDAKLLAEHGVAYHGEYHRNVLGISYRLAIEFYKKTFGISAPTEQMMKRRGEIAAEFFADKVELFPGTRQVLEQLRKMNLRIGLATSSVGASARPFLDRHKLASLFDAIITGDEVEHGKPAPDIYLRAAAKLQVPPRACVVVEDALSGIEAARAAGMRVIAIPDTRYVDKNVYAEKADYVLDKITELPQLNELRESPRAPS